MRQPPDFFAGAALLAVAGALAAGAVAAVAGAAGMAVLAVAGVLAAGAAAVALVAGAVVEDSSWLQAASTTSSEDASAIRANFMTIP